MKAQPIRLADVFLIGPAMIAGGLELRTARPVLGVFLVLSGAATIVYNYRNYRAVQALEQSER